MNLWACLWRSPGTAGVVVRHQTESIDYRGQLLKLLPAKHTRLPRTVSDGKEKKKREVSTDVSDLFLAFIWK